MFIDSIKKLTFEGDWVELGPKFFLLRQSWTKYLEQNRETQQNWTGLLGFN